MVSRKDIGIDDLESMPEFKCGLWYSPYVKIYSIGGPNRIAEISSYPRAYKDTSSHVYTEDTPFVVTESDLNHEVEGKRFYRDSKDKLFSIGEEATHYIGDSLPGAFPLWLESEEIPFTSALEKHEFSIDKIPGPIKGLAEAQQKVAAAFEKLPEEAVVAIRENLPTGKITLARKPADSNKQIIRIKYKRVF
ncbi:hypothetical protein ES703_29758 [subsurface metagenome]